MRKHLKTHFSLVLGIIISQTLLVFLVSSLIVNAATETGRDQSTVPASNVDDTIAESGLANCRYGVASLSGSHMDWVDELGAGWYLNFSPISLPAPNDAEFVPVIKIKQNKTPSGQYLPAYTVTPSLTDTELGITIDNNPGALWVVGNEVDRGPDPGEIESPQGDTFPEIYAQAYHQVYHYIKQRDPTAQVAISALVQVTPGRLQYLDIVWDTYLDMYGGSIPVDVWNMHLYVLPEVNADGDPNGIATVALGSDPAVAKREGGGDPAQCPLDDVYCFAEHDDLSIFEDQIYDMRRWMLDHGQRNKPLILSEFSLLYPYEVDPGGTCFLQDEFGECFTPERVVDFLNGTMSILESLGYPGLGYPPDNNRLVQQWLWFSVSNVGNTGYVSDLMQDGQLTVVGEVFQDIVLSNTSYVNLLPSSVSNPTADSVNGLADVTLTVTIRNNGNKTAEDSFFVTFFKDPELTQVIGWAEVPAPSSSNQGMTGCARREISVSTVWEDLPSGIYPYWVKVDSSQNIPETDENDNVGSGLVMIDPIRSFLPVSRR